MNFKDWTGGGSKGLSTIPCSPQKEKEKKTYLKPPLMEMNLLLPSGQERYAMVMFLKFENAVNFH